MNDTDQVLKEISASLKKAKTAPKPQVGYDAQAVKRFISGQVVPSLEEALNICDQITDYVDSEISAQQLKVAFNSLAKNVEQLKGQFTLNLKKIDSVQDGLQNRIDRFNVLEAKYKRMIDRVVDVLDLLEQKLKQL